MEYMAALDGAKQTLTRLMDDVLNNPQENDEFMCAKIRQVRDVLFLLDGLLRQPDLPMECKDAAESLRHIYGGMLKSCEELILEYNI